MRKYHFPLQFNESQPIGLYEVCFDQLSQYIYRLNDKGANDLLFVRKKNWNSMLKSVQCTMDKFKTKILVNYIDRVYLPMKEY